ncbi:MAG: (2Fe-2S) ferredoxin domain-containing protein [Oscillatoriales cyanobacterium]|nr:MAG: (2Fe-2S) ferredoxin domain-containing protein [Oscillatoriales cyanobacterium]
MILRSGGQELEVVLTKKLRPLLALELQPGDRLRLLTETKKQKTIAINIMKILSPTITDDDRPQSSAPAAPSASPTRPGVILEICRKGTCRKRGSLELVERWQAEADRNPSFVGLECRLTGCLKHCKAGVNVRVGDRVVSHAQTMRLEEITR